MLRLFSAALSFYAMGRMYRLYRPQISDPVLGKWFLTCSFLLWFSVYNGVRFSSENWSGACFVIAFAWYFSKNRQQTGFYETVGALLGLAFVFRFQTGLMIAGLLAWIALVEKTRWDKLLRILAGMMITLGIGILADRWFYGEWTFTAWHYFEQNILQGKAASFGVKPWWWYFSESFMQAIPPFSLLFIGSVLLVLRYQPKNALSWVVLPFLLVHCLIGHKELRFLFPLIGFLPILLIKGLEIIEEKWAPALPEKRYFRVFMRLFFVVNGLLLALVAFRPADNQISLYRAIYEQYPAPTVLYCPDENPYHRVLDIHFYKKNTLEIRKINAADSIPPEPGKTQLIALRRPNNTPEFLAHYRLVYSSFPEWLFRFNFNHWVERTNAWYVYERIAFS